VRKGEGIYNEKFKDKQLSDEEWIKVMVDNPILIERPIIVDGKRAVIGRPPENIQQLM
jgi:arsenate reductase